jgi:hypothetical protein
MRGRILDALIRAGYAMAWMSPIYFPYPQVVRLREFWEYSAKK